VTVLRFAALVVAVAPLAATAGAQGLGDTAARERAKRAKVKQDAKVFTNDDLDAGRPPGTKKPEEGSSSQPYAATSESSESSESPESSEQQEAQQENQESTAPRSLSVSERAEQERSYRDAITAAQQGVTAAEGRVRQLQDKLNPMSVSFIFGAGGSNDPNEEIRVREELRQAEANLQSARQAEAEARKNLEDFRQGRPPRR
jgi:hypothetical protein